METNAMVDHIKNLLENDLADLEYRKAVCEATAEYKEHETIVASIKAKKTEIEQAMLNLYRTTGIASIKTETSTAYVKNDYEILMGRLSLAQVLAIYYVNPDAFQLSDKDVRDSIELARKARANGDVSEEVDTVMALDLERIRSPAISKPVVRAAKVAKA